MDLLHLSVNNDIDKCNFYLPSFGFSWCHFERIANLSKTGTVGFWGHFKGITSWNRTGRGVQSWNCIQSPNKSMYFQLNSTRNVFFDHSSKSPGLWYRSHVSGWIWQIQGTVGQKATISSLSADWSKQMIPTPVGFYTLQPPVNTALKTKSTWCVLQRDRWHACTDTEQTSQLWDETWPGRGKILQNGDSISIRRLPMTRKSKPTAPAPLPFGLMLPR